MGLLDGYAVDQTPRGLLGPMPPDDQAAARSRALTALGAGLLAGRGNFSSILGNAVMQGQQAYDSGMDAAMRRRLMDSQLSENAAQARYRDMMLQAQQQKLAHDKALEDRQARFWSGLGASADPAQAVIAQTGGLAPTRTNAALMDQAPQGLRITPELVAQAAAAGIDIGNLQKIAEARNWNRDKVARTIETVGPDGKPVTQQFTEYGQSVGTAMPKPYERKFQDMGGTVQGLDPYTGQPLGTGLAKSMTPDAVASNQLGWANNRIAGGQLGLAQQRIEEDKRQFGLNFDKPQMVQTDQGFMWAQPRSGAVQPAVGPDGKPLQPRLKDVPSAQATAMIENGQAVRKIDEAIAALKANPDALGLKNFMPDAAVQRIDPAGADVRARIADIGGTKYHDLSGAAVSVSEAARLAPYIPSAHDSPAVAMQKLQNLRREYVSTLDALQSGYGRDQGFRPMPVPQAASGGGFRVLGRE